MTRARTRSLLTTTALGATTLATIALLAACTDTTELDAARAGKKPTKPTPADARDAGATLDPVPNIPLPVATRTPVAGSCTGQLTGALQVPAWRAPHAKQPGACTLQEATTVATCTLGKQACTGVSAACLACAVSNAATSPTSGALITDPNGAAEPEINVEGCAAALLGDTSAAGCGPRLQAQFKCESQTCGGCDGAQAAQCSATASQGACATYAQSAAQCMAAANQCMSAGTTSQEIAAALVQLFCT